MKEFFKGWRRKTGVLILAMACVFAAGWVRSTKRVDFIDVVHKRDLYFFFSGGQKLYFARNVAVRVPLRPAEVRRFLLSPNPDRSREFPFEWSHKVYPASEILIYTDGDVPKLVTVIHYWWLVVPLTLLSAWLLLSKPRRRKTPVERAVEKAA